MNKMQKYSKQLSDSNKGKGQTTWRGQSLEQLTEGWDDNLDTYANLQQTENWLRRAAGKLPRNEA